ncbi:Aldo/keto reductase [Auricularia subglabra TFB-10046 SS5]|nr:Aldo/keto reductase [Auricularia subglabra TFB-10046 SS5]
MSYGSVKLNDGRRAPRIAYGAGSVWKREDVTPYVLQALREGFDHLDNAQYYGNEQYVGAAIAQSGLSRKDLFITSKFGFGNVDEAIAASLSNLGVDYLDLYLIHNPISAGDDIPGTWAALERVRARGQAISIGVSNFGVDHLTVLLASAQVVPVVNQIQLHPYNYAEQLASIELCARHGIVIEAYSSLTPITKTPGGPVDAPLARAAKRIGGTPAQVIFQWLRQKGFMIVTTSGKAERLQEYLAVPSLPPLTDEEITGIEEAGKQGTEWYKNALRGEKEAASTTERSDWDLEAAQTTLRNDAGRRRWFRILLSSALLFWALRQLHITLCN